MALLGLKMFWRSLNQNNDYSKRETSTSIDRQPSVSTMENVPFQNYKTITFVHIGPDHHPRFEFPKNDSLLKIIHLNVAC